MLAQMRPGAGACIRVCSRAQVMFLCRVGEGGVRASSSVSGDSASLLVGELLVSCDSASLLVGERLGGTAKTEGEQPQGGWEGSSESCLDSVGSIPWSAAKNGWGLLREEPRVARKCMRGGREPNDGVEIPWRGERSGEHRSRVGNNIRRVETDSQSEQHSGVESSRSLDVVPGGLLKSRYRPDGHCASTPHWSFRPLAGVVLGWSRPVQGDFG